MLEGFQFPQPDDAGDRKLLADVERHGWHIVSVFDEKEDEDGPKRPDFAFSVGLYYRYEHPELLISGLKSNVAGNLINAIGKRIGEEHTFPIGQRIPDILEGFDVIFRPVDILRYSEHLGYALWFYRNLLPRTFPVVQLVWPDKSNHFPWEPGFDSRYKSLQEELWSPSGMG